jgi:hypothetical protein
MVLSEITDIDPLELDKELKPADNYLDASVSFSPSSGIAKRGLHSKAQFASPMRL